MKSRYGLETAYLLSRKLVTRKTLVITEDLEKIVPGRDCGSGQQILFRVP